MKKTFNLLRALTVACFITTFAADNVEIEKESPQENREALSTSKSGSSTPEEILRQLESQTSPTITTITSKSTEPESLVSVGRLEDQQVNDNERNENLENIPLNTKTQSAIEQPKKSTASSTAQAVSQFIKAIRELFTWIINNFRSARTSPVSAAVEKLDIATRLNYRTKIENLMESIETNTERLNAELMPKEEYTQGVFYALAEMISSTNDLVSRLSPTDEMDIKFAQLMRDNINDLISTTLDLDTGLNLTNNKIQPSIYDTLYTATGRLSSGEKRDFTELFKLEYQSPEGKAVPIKPFGTA